MRTRLKVGLLAAVIACGAFVAAKAQEEKSYLPPKWSSQQKSETTIPKTWAPKTVQARPVRHASANIRHARVYHHSRTRVAHHRGYHRQRYAYRGYRGYYRQRYAYYRPAFPGFLFGLFNW